MLASIKRLEDRIAVLDEEIASAREKEHALASQVEETERKLQQEEQKYIGIVSGTSQDQEEMLKGELLDLLNKIAQERNECRHLAEQKELADRRWQKLMKDADERSEQDQSRSAVLQQLEEKLTELRSKIEERRQTYLDSAEALKQRQQDITQISQVMRKWEQKIDALVSRRETLNEMKEDFDGYMHGVKEVLKARNRQGSGSLKGIHGAVAELMKVPKDYEIAVETAMGGALQHVVMEDEASARSAIAYLKQRQLGRATFLPLDVIRARTISPSEQSRLEQLDGYVGIAASLITCEPKYSNIIGSLLGNVIIAESLEHANKIAARASYRYRVVTLDGDIVNAGGSMTGGSIKRKNAGLLSRSRQIEELDKEISQAKEQMELLRTKYAEAKSTEQQAVEAIERLRSEGEQLRMDEQQLLAQVQQEQTELRHLKQQLDLIRAEAQQQEQESKSLEQRKQMLLEQLDQLEKEEANLQLRIRDAEQSRKASESEKDLLQGQLTELKVQLASAERDRQAVAEQCTRLEQDRIGLQDDLHRQQEAKQKTEQDLESNEQEAVLQLELLNSLKLKRQACSEEIEFKRAEREKLQRFIESEEEKTKEERTQLKQVEEQLRFAEVKVNRLDVELEGLLRKLSEEYELSFELAKSRYPVPEDVTSTQECVRDIKRRIASLGEVNLGAIDEYQRISERFEFLTQQQNDLLEAKQSLYQVIREMDEEMSRRFYSTFEDIRGHFIHVFSRLFGGGRADLILSEPKNPLETGIEIVAQPPGKKLQNLQLLSGGERALTAIALLFAILHVKPVPFCVLDEVEAALDEANVSRFAEYLREFSEQTQFIVVTHRKGTMEEADVLYGVTMEEGGVSKLVSVKLDDEAVVSA